MDKEKSEWVFTPQRIEQKSLMDSLQNDLLQAVLTVVQDGICILDCELNIIYANPALICWYPKISDVRNQKCYAAYHGLDAPCQVCPTLRAFESKLPHTDVVRYDGIQKDGGWQRLYCVPVLDKNGNAVLVIEYIRDISDQRKAELISEFVESQNATLVNYLEQQQQKAELQQHTILENVERSIKPVLGYLDKMLGKDSMDIVRRQLDISLHGITQSKSHLALRLTPREMQIAALIKDNHISKEIADQLGISKKAVDFHRTHIRKKLGLKPEENLQRFLEMNL